MIVQAILQVTYNVLLPIFFTAGLGYWFAKRFHPDITVFTKLSIYILMPCLVFSTITSSEVEVGEMGRLTALVILQTGLLIGVGYLLSRWFQGLGRPTRTAILLAIVLGNSGNYGIPLIEFAFGPAGGQRGVLIAVLGTIVINTVGVYIASSGKKASVRAAIRAVLSIPLPYAVILALLIRFLQIELPLPVARTVSMLAQATVPLLLMLLGAQLSNVSLRSLGRERFKAMAAVTGVRLLVGPLMVVALAPFLGIEGITRSIAIVQLGMPTAVNSALLSAEFGADSEFASTVILISTLASIVTLSFMLPLVVPGGG